jgi:hypothetical protein
LQQIGCGCFEASYNLGCFYLFHLILVYSIRLFRRDNMG